MTELDLIKKHEGFRPLPYKDSRGILTIGYGFNLDEVGLSKGESDMLLRMRVRDRIEQLQTLSFYQELNEVRRAVLLDMSYQLGWSGLMKFKKMLTALRVHDYDAASRELIDSLYAAQTPHRAEENANLLKFGKWNE